VYTHTHDRERARERERERERESKRETRGRERTRERERGRERERVHQHVFLPLLEPRCPAWRSQFPPPSAAPDDARAVTSSDPLAPAQRDAYTAMQGQKKLVRAREGGRGERKSSGYHAVDQLDVGLSCETDRERERIRTVRRRVYVPSIGHLFPPFLYDRRRSEGLTARRCCAKTKPRAAARRFTAEEREREREKEREQIERQFEQ
jgi:hypothetical protein